MIRQRHLYQLFGICIVLAVVLCSFNSGKLAAFAGNSKASFEVGASVTANLLDDGTLELVGEGDTFDYRPGDPSPLSDFSGDISSVTIDDRITSIGSYLFYNCEQLTGTLSIPASVVKIGDHAFDGDSPEQGAKFVQIENAFTERTVVEDRSTDLPEELEPVPNGTEGENPVDKEENTPFKVSEEPEKPEDPPEIDPGEGDLPTEDESVSPSTEPDAGENENFITSEESSAPTIEEPEEPVTEGETTSDSDSSEAPEIEPEPPSEPLTYQEIGSDIFSSGQTGVYRCASTNDTFAAAVEGAGYVNANVFSIVQQPETVDCVIGAETEFHVWATSKNPDKIKYQWQRSTKVTGEEGEEDKWEALSQETEDTLILSSEAALQMAKEGTMLRCVVTFEGNTIESDEVTVHLPDVPLVEVTYLPGDGSGDAVPDSAVLTDNGVLLGACPASFHGLKGDALFHYIFAGWRVLNAEEEIVYGPEDYCPPANEGEVLTLYAVWRAEVRVELPPPKAETGEEKTILTIALPRVEGYTLTVGWQYSDNYSPIAHEGEQTEWKDIKGAEGERYERELESDDVGRYFRCVVTAKKDFHGLSSLFAKGEDERTTFASPPILLVPTEGMRMDTSWYSEAQEVFTISTPGQLLGLAAMVNGTEGDPNDFAGKTIRLDADIMLDSTKPWTPIGVGLTASGEPAKPFAGTFDGCGHSVGGMEFADPDGMYQGLFGYLTGVVQNCWNACDIKGGAYIGGLVGFNQSGTVRNCYNTGTIRGGQYVGGIVGLNQSGTVENCYNIGSVIGVNFVGGITGSNGGTLQNCYYLSTTAEEICGINDGVVAGCGSFEGKSGMLSPVDGNLFVYGTSLLDSLNGWASGHAADGVKFYGWRRGNDGYPVLDPNLVPYSRVIYVKGDGDDGQSGVDPAHAVATLAAAYEKIGNQPGIVVICGVLHCSELVVSGETQAVITSTAPDGIDYRKTTGASLTFEKNGGLCLGADATIEQLELNGGTLYAQGHSLTIGEGVTLADDKSGPVILGGGPAELGTAEKKVNPSICIESGQFEAVYGGGGTAWANPTVSISGGKIERVYGAGMTEMSGGVTIEVNGGQIGTIFGGGSNNFHGISAINLRGGRVGTVYGGGDESDVNGAAFVKVYGGSVANAIYGGGRKGTVSGSVSVMLMDSISSEEETIPAIFAGGDDGRVDGAAEVVIQGGSLGKLCGGGTTGTSISLSGGSVATIEGAAGGKVSGDVQITIAGSSAVQSILGGTRNSDGVVSGDVTLRLAGGTVTGNVYGGGGEIDGNTIVHITPEAQVDKSVYGGARQGGTVSGTASVMVEPGATVKGDVYGGGSEDMVSYTAVSIEGCVQGNVFGGGKNGGTAGSTVVTVEGQVKGSIYGGGNDAAVSGDTAVTTAGDVAGSVHGGGLGRFAVENASVAVTGGRIEGSVYGCGAFEGADGVAFTSVRKDAGITVVGSPQIEGGIDGKGRGFADVGEGARTVLLRNCDLSGIGCSLGAISQASDVTLDHTTLTLLGMAKQGHSAAYSLRDIDCLRLRNNSLLTLQAPVDSVSALISQVGEGDTVSSLSQAKNSIQLDGIQQLTLSDFRSGAMNYGLVTGQFILRTDETADSYVIGHKNSTGGFWLPDGTGGYTELNAIEKSDYKCWRLGEPQTFDYHVDLIARYTNEKKGGTDTQTVALPYEAEEEHFKVTEVTVKAASEKEPFQLVENLENLRGNEVNTSFTLTMSGEAGPWKGEILLPLTEGTKGPSLIAAAGIPELHFTLGFAKGIAKDGFAGTVTVTLTSVTKPDKNVVVALTVVRQPVSVGKPQSVSASVSAGKHFMPMGGGEKEISITSNSAFTVELQSIYAADGANTAHQVTFVNPLPLGTALILTDCTGEFPIYYYYRVENPTISVLFTDFMEMGTKKPYHEPEKGVREELILLTVDLANAAAQRTHYAPTLVIGDVEVDFVDVTTTAETTAFFEIRGEEGMAASSDNALLKTYHAALGEDIGYFYMGQDMLFQAAPPSIVRSGGVDTYYNGASPLLVLRLDGSDGTTGKAPVDFIAITADGEEQASIDGKIFLPYRASEGLTFRLNTEKAQLRKGSYTLSAQICLSNSLRGALSSAVGKEKKLRFHIAEVPETVLDVEMPDDGQRLVDFSRTKRGGSAVLSLRVTTLPQDMQNLRCEVQKKIDGHYVNALSNEWTINLKPMEAGVTAVTVRIPRPSILPKEAETYRLLFTVEDGIGKRKEKPFNLIVK